MTDLHLKIKTHLEQNLPFVIFCKPNSDKTVGLFQKNDHLYFLDNYDKKGFVFAPFESELIPFIPLQYSDVYVEKNKENTFFVAKEPQTAASKKGNDFFESLVEKAVNAIQEKHFQKVVLSRREVVAISTFDIENCFNRMLQSYPTAFKYCFFHPKIGLWAGATPEQLVQIKETNFETVALAGTQKAAQADAVKWTAKEIKEQQLVTDYILNQIQDFTKKLDVSHPETIKAGSIFHIKTMISGTLKNKKSVKKIITALHPTSAVCGTPRAEARAFINNNEGYNREYYAGFLGELNIDLATFKTQHTDLFVNLRCMKIGENTAQLFVGCGITGESDPKAEYEETENKAMTMKSCIL
jgi:isochorismate synthase